MFYLLQKPIGHSFTLFPVAHGHIFKIQDLAILVILLCSFIVIKYRLVWLCGWVFILCVFLL